MGLAPQEVWASRGCGVWKAHPSALLSDPAAGLPPPDGPWASWSLPAARAVGEAGSQVVGPLPSLGKV